MTAEEIRQEIANKAVELIEDESLFVVEVKYGGAGKHTALTVLLDGDEGVSIEQCAELSRKLGAYVEEEDLVSGAYRLEVSSPGIDEPLKLPRQYKANVGRKLKLWHKPEGAENAQEALGKLLSVEENSITLAAETGKGKKKQTEERKVPFAEIEKAVVQVAFR